MAKKLTPEELRLANAPDFDPPVDPGQTRLFGTQKVSKKKSAAAPAQSEPAKKTKNKTPKPKPKPEKANAAPAPQEKHAGGRPKKGNEETRIVSFRLPERIIRRLRVRGALDGVSSADVIIRLADEMDVPGIDDK